MLADTLFRLSVAISSRWVLLVAAVSSLALASAARAATLAGRVVFSVDGGVVTSTVDGGGADASAALPGGDVVLAGGGSVGSPPVYVAELGPSGTLGPSFGVGGIAHIDVPLVVSQVLAEPDGKLLLVGRGSARSKLELPEILVAQLNADGTLDTTYGHDGMASTGIEAGCDCADAAITASGELLVAGATGSYSPALEHNPNAPSNFRWVVEELGINGTPDQAFGEGGIASIPVSDAVGASLSLLPAGAIYTDGQTETAGSTKLYVTRLTATGAADSTFADGTPVQLPFSSAFAMLAQPDGAVTIASASSGTLVRYTNTGAIDAAFGSGGEVSVPSAIGQLLAGPGSDVLFVSSPQGLGALDDSPAQRTLRVEPITPSGTIDSSLGTPVLALPFGGGLSSLPFGPPASSPSLVQDSFNGTLVQRSDGSYLATGNVGVAEPTDNEGDGYSIYDFAAAAFTSSFAPDPSFGLAPPPLHIALRLPAQRAATDVRAGAIHVVLAASTPGLAGVTIRAHGALIAQSVEPLFTSGSHTAAVQLTRAGTRALRAGRRISVTIRATARDLLAVTAGATGRGTIA